MNHANPVILVVDADDASRRALEMSLRKEGFQVRAVASGSGAVAVLEGETVHGLVCDLQIEGMGGLTLIRALQDEPRFAAIPFVVTASTASVSDKVRALELGATAVLRKPLVTREVVDELRGALTPVAAAPELPLSGDVRNHPLHDLLHAAVASNRRGAIRIRHDERTGTVYFADGNIIDASTGNDEGQSALRRLFTWESGLFETRLVDQLDRERTITSQAPDLITDGILYAAEWRDTLAQVGSLDAVYHIEYRSLATHIGELPPEANAFIRMFDGHRTLEEAIADCDIPDTLALSLVRRFIDGNILERVGAPLRAPTPSTPASNDGFDNLPPSGAHDAAAPQSDLDDWMDAGSVAGRDRDKRREDLIAAEKLHIERDRLRDTIVDRDSSIARLNAAVRAEAKRDRHDTIANGQFDVGTERERERQTARDEARRDAEAALAAADKARLQAEAAQRAVDELARLEAEELARLNAEQARRAAEEAERRAAEEAERRAAAEQARREEDERLSREAQLKAQREAESARLAAEEAARLAEEARARRVEEQLLRAEELAKLQAEDEKLSTLKREELALADVKGAELRAKASQLAEELRREAERRADAYDQKRLILENRRLHLTGENDVIGDDELDAKPSDAPRPTDRMGIVNLDQQDKHRSVTPAILQRPMEVDESPRILKLGSSTSNNERRAADDEANKSGAGLKLSPNSDPEVAGIAAAGAAAAILARNADAIADRPGEMGPAKALPSESVVVRAVSGANQKVDVAAETEPAGLAPKADAATAPASAAASAAQPAANTDHRVDSVTRKVAGGDDVIEDFFGKEDDLTDSLFITNENHGPNATWIAAAVVAAVVVLLTFLVINGARKARLADEANNPTPQAELTEEVVDPVEVDPVEAQQAAEQAAADNSYEVEDQALGVVEAVDLAQASGTAPGSGSGIAPGTGEVAAGTGIPAPGTGAQPDNGFPEDEIAAVIPEVVIPVVDEPVEEEEEPEVDEPEEEEEEPEVDEPEEEEEPEVDEPEEEEEEEEPADEGESDIEAAEAACEDAFDSRNYRDAIDACEDVLSLQSSNSAALTAIGQSHYELGNLDETVEYLERALRVRRRNRDALMILGAALQEQGDNSGARAAYESFLEYYGDSSRADEIRRVLESM